MTVRSGIRSSVGVSLQLEGPSVLPRGGRSADDGQEQDQGPLLPDANVPSGVDGSGGETLGGWTTCMPHTMWPYVTHAQRRERSIAPACYVHWELLSP